MATLQTRKQKRADLQSQFDMIDDELNDDYLDLDQTRVQVGNGERGDKNYGAMGFVRKSDRASGLTRKTKMPTGGKS